MAQGSSWIGCLRQRSGQSRQSAIAYRCCGQHLGTPVTQFERRLCAIRFFPAVHARKPCVAGHEAVPVFSGLPEGIKVFELILIDLTHVLNLAARFAEQGGHTGEFVVQARAKACVQLCLFGKEHIVIQRFEYWLIGNFGALRIPLGKQRWCAARFRIRSGSRQSGTAYRRLGR